MSKKAWVLLLFLSILLALHNIMSAIGRSGISIRTASEVSVSCVHTQKSIHSKEEQQPSHTDYIWVGNHWIPPPGVPTYSPKDYLQYFQKRNVLFLGGSTARRAYATLFAMMNSTSFTDIKVPALDHRSVVDINKNTIRSKKEKCTLVDRKLYYMNGSEYKHDIDRNAYVCRNLVPKSCLTEHIDASSTTSNRSCERASPGQMRTGKFDYIKQDCLTGISRTFTNYLNSSTSSGVNHIPQPSNSSSFLGSLFLQDYDLVVVMAGIHETIKGCGPMEINGNENNKNPVDHTSETLKILKQASSSELQVVFRSVGFMSDHGQDTNHWKMINVTQRFFKELQTEINNNNITSSKLLSRWHPNITLVDWGSVISHRSWDADRIQGDMPPHYGLEARLLFAQQLLHQLLLTDGNGKIWL